MGTPGPRGGLHRSPIFTIFRKRRGNVYNGGHRINFRSKNAQLRASYVPSIDRCLTGRRFIIVISHGFPTVGFASVEDSGAATLVTRLSGFYRRYDKTQQTSLILETKIRRLSKHVCIWPYF